MSERADAAEKGMITLKLNNVATYMTKIDERSESPHWAGRLCYYLSVVSSVFRDLFALTEATEGKEEMQELELKDLDASEFKEFLGVNYPTCFPISDTNVISLFRIADRFDVQRVVADCERHLLGANCVPMFDKLKLAVGLNRGNLRAHLLSKTTSDDFEAIKETEGLHQLGPHVLQALFEKHVGTNHD